ncbi:MAG: hypothetical protein AAGI17_04860 [Planctomycetota bacterium]
MPTENEGEAPKARKVLEAIHVTAAGIWVGVLVLAGASAAILFPKMKELAPRLPDFEAYRPEAHWRLAAGITQNEIFKVADIAQFALATACLATLIAMLVFGGLDTKKWSTGVRITLLTIAMSLLSYNLFFLAPRMQANATTYWEAARTGEVETADAAYAAFDADHPTASRVLGGTAIAVLGVTIAGAWSATVAGESRKQA